MDTGFRGKQLVCIMPLIGLVSPLQHRNLSDSFPPEYALYLSYYIARHMPTLTSVDTLFLPLIQSPLVGNLDNYGKGIHVFPHQSLVKYLLVLVAVSLSLLL